MKQHVERPKQLVDITRIDLAKIEELAEGKGEPNSGEAFQDFIARNGNKPIGATASAEPDQDTKQYSTYSFGAVFAEVGVDESLGTPRVRRIQAVYDVGTLFNQKLGHSQLIGGIVWRAAWRSMSNRLLLFICLLRLSP